jgi:hypothetical protein
MQGAICFLYAENVRKVIETIVAVERIIVVESLIIVRNFGKGNYFKS